MILYILIYSVIQEVKTRTFFLAHPGNSHYAFQDESYLYLVLDLARGGDLRYNLSASGGRFSEERAKFYVAQVVLALDYLHQIGIIHRDVKPENILLNNDGYVKLTDFGVSKVLNVKTGDCRSTSGTHGYMAPEMYVAPGYRHGTPADWFAVGVTLFELLVGQRPFDSKTLKNNQCKEGGVYQLYTGFMSPQEGSDLSVECQHFLRGLLHPRPDMRLSMPQLSSKIHRLKDSNKHTSSSHNVLEQPWLRHMNWEMLYHRALPAPLIPDLFLVRSCLSTSDAHVVLEEHLQTQAVAESDQVHFAEYFLDKQNTGPPLLESRPPKTIENTNHRSMHEQQPSMHFTTSLLLLAFVISSLFSTMQQQAMTLSDALKRGCLILLRLLCLLIIQSRMCRESDTDCWWTLVTTVPHIIYVEIEIVFSVYTSLHFCDKNVQSGQFVAK